jgi:hypothetical protein
MILRIATISDLVRAGVPRHVLVRLLAWVFTALGAGFYIWQCVRVLGN